MKILMLAGQGSSTTYIYNGIVNTVEIDKILITSPPSKKKLIQRRVKKLGLFKVLDQLVFQVFVVRYLNLISKSKIAKLKEILNLKSSPIPKEKILDVGAVNSAKTIQELKKFNPDIVLVNGTSIISKKVLTATNAIFINTHVGITPEYRGVHGGYWALRNQDRNNFGVTIHQIDTGIDTGDIIYQATGKPHRNDNFLTYPLIQIALAIPLLKKTFEDISNNKLKTYQKKNTTSKLYYHPGFTTYLWGRIKYRVK